MSILLVALFGALSVVASAQPTYSFEPVLFEPPAPTPRLDSPPVFDPVSRRLYVFGGDPGSGRTNDLWAYSFEQAAWIELSPTGDLPAARSGHTMVLDAARRRLVVFGGQAAGFFNDVWAYDLAGNTWTQVGGADPAPTPRYGHSAIVDSRNRMVISHGFSSRGRFDDTWVFDLATDLWSDISPERRPLRRCLHHAVYDPARDQMLLFGGCASGVGPCPLGDLWALDLKTETWRQLSSDPPPRQFYGMAFDPGSQRMILYGGDGRNGLLPDVWEYDPATDNWNEPAVVGAMPPARSRLEGAFVDGIGVVFFGGTTSAGLTNEVWLFALASAPATSAQGVVNAFNFAGGAVAPGEIVSLFVNDAGPAMGVSSQFDADGVLPFELAGVTVTFDGMRSPLYFVSKTQINAQVPYEKALETEVDLVVSYRGQSSEPVQLAVVAAKAGLFPAVFNQDGTLNSELNPATAGSAVTLFVTGQGVTIPPSRSGAYPTGGLFPKPVAAVGVEIGGEPVATLFEGQAPFTAGVMQLNVKLGDASGALAVKVFIGDAASQEGVVVWVAPGSQLGAGRLFFKTPRLGKREILRSVALSQPGNFLLGGMRPFHEQGPCVQPGPEGS